MSLDEQKKKGKNISTSAFFFHAFHRGERRERHFFPGDAAPPSYNGGKGKFRVGRNLKTWGKTSGPCKIGAETVSLKKRENGRWKKFCEPFAQKKGRKRSHLASTSPEKRLWASIA